MFLCHEHNPEPRLRSGNSSIAWPLCPLVLGTAHQIQFASRRLRLVGNRIRPPKHPNAAMADCIDQNYLCQESSCLIQQNGLKKLSVPAIVALFVCRRSVCVCTIREYCSLPSAQQSQLSFPSPSLETARLLLRLVLPFVCNKGGPTPGMQSLTP